MKQTSGTFECVRYYDPAIAYPSDDGGKAALEYCMRRDITKLSFVDPTVALPMIFVCRRLTQAQRRQVTSATDDAELRRRAFQYGVIAVKNYVTDAGQVVTWEPKRQDDGARMDDSYLDDFGEDDIQEIGHVIRDQSFLARGVKLRSLPLASSQAAYLAVRLRSAE